MLKKIFATFFLLFIYIIAIYPSKKEDTKFTDYCYSLEKILSRNALEKSKYTKNEFKNFAKDIILYGTNKSKGTLVNKAIDRYKISKKKIFISLVPNQVLCLTGYWIEVLKPGTFTSIIYEKSKQKINKFKDIKEGAEGLIRDIDTEYESIKKGINEFFQKK